LSTTGRPALRHPILPSAWPISMAESLRLADEFSDALVGGRPIDAAPLA
jgi:hypothetical protein